MQGYYYLRGVQQRSGDIEVNNIYEERNACPPMAWTKQSYGLLQLLMGLLRFARKISYLSNTIFLVTLKLPDVN